MDRSIHSKIPILQRLSHKLLEYGAISAYLYLFFATFLFFKTAALRSQGIDYAPYGLAVAKALLLAKFILVGHKLRIGAPFRHATLIHLIIHKSVLFLLHLIGLSGIEEAILGLIHHRAIGDAMADLRGGRLGQIIASSLLLFLVLIPYFAFRELDRALGEGRLLQLLRQRAHAREEQKSLTREYSPSGQGENLPGIVQEPAANARSSATT
jgi:hypothetical protein